MLIPGRGQALCSHYEHIQIRSLNSHYEQSDKQTLKVPHLSLSHSSPPPPTGLYNCSKLYFGDSSNTYAE
jgi:hypothetical protein